MNAEVEYLRAHMPANKKMAAAIEQLIAMAEKRYEAEKFAKQVHEYLCWHEGTFKRSTFNVARFKTQAREFVKLMGVE